MTPNAIQIYCDLMREIRFRNLYIQAVGNIPLLGGYRITRIESICLQIRMILENIALSCLVANGDRIDSLPNKIDREYHAEAILRRLDRINPDCFPQPQILEPPADKTTTNTEIKSHAINSVRRYRGKLIPRTGKDWMNRDEFKKVYGRLGGILHARNPLGSRVDLSYFEHSAPSWQTKFMNLLQHHKISVIEENMMYIVQMNAVSANTKDKSKGDVTVTRFQKISTEL